MNIKEIVDAIKEIAMIPADFYVKIEKEVTSRGIVVVMLTGTVCYMMVTGMKVSQSFVDFYTLIIGAYFGLKLIPEFIDRLKKPE